MALSTRRCARLALISAISVGSFLHPSTLQAQSPLPGASRMELLWPDGAPGAVGDQANDKPNLSIYLPPPEQRNGCSIVVCPGGGYGHLAVGHEGEQVGKWLNSFGVTAFVLRYRLAPRYHYPAPLLDAQRAVRMVRARAKEWNVDPRRIGILGFSAGGHLASSAGTHFDAGKKDAADPIDRVSCRPDFMVLGYPVISFTEDFTHRGSRRNFVGKGDATKLHEAFSNEKQVTKETPPTFLVHTTEDRGVPAENSIVFYLALKKAGIAAEMHIYEKGRHGLGLGPKNMPFSSWPKRCEAWLLGRGFLAAKASG
jgi:acetyl esterase/lipase